MKRVFEFEGERLVLDEPQQGSQPQDTKVLMAANPPPPQPQPQPKPGAIKLDASKTKYVAGVLALFPRALKAVAEVSAVGAAKYGLEDRDTNFAQVEGGFNRYTEAEVRHLMAELQGERWNVEKGGFLPPEGIKVLTAAQNAWNALARLEILIVNMENE